VRHHQCFFCFQFCDFEISAIFPKNESSFFCQVYTKENLKIPIFFVAQVAKFRPKKKITGSSFTVVFFLANFRFFFKNNSGNFWKFVFFLCNFDPIFLFQGKIRQNLIST
jgi:hypothetical protein